MLEYLNPSPGPAGRTTARGFAYYWRSSAREIPVCRTHLQACSPSTNLEPELKTRNPLPKQAQVMKLLRLIAVIVAALPCTATSRTSATEVAKPRFNVLFIAVDDLRPEL